MTHRIRPGTAGRIAVPGGTCRRVIDLAGDDPESHRVEFLQLAAVAGSPVFRQIFEVTGRYTLIRPGCLDCTGTVTTIEPGAEFDSALVLVHDGSCPAFAGAVALYRAGGAL